MSKKTFKEKYYNHKMSFERKNTQAIQRYRYTDAVK